MATTKPFAYNPSKIPISGTIQFGDFVYGEPTSGFTDSPQFWNGPDEDLGYIIAQPVPTGNQPNPVGIPAYLGFFRTEGFSDESFVNLVSTIADQQFLNSTDAYNWIISNGYYTNYSSLAPTPTRTPTPTPTESVTPTPTPSVTVTQTNTPTPTQEQLINPILIGNNEYLSVGNNEYLEFTD